MLNDINFTKRYEMTFHKALFSENELSLSKCLNFTFVPENSTIICNLETTTKLSLVEFIKEAFIKIWTHPLEASFKNELVIEIDKRYDELRNTFNQSTLKKLGYEEKLFEHQKEGLFNIHKKQNNLLAFEMGTGKTILASSLSKMLSIKRTLIICPASLKFNWMKELTGSILNFNEMYISLLDANKSRTIKAFQERFVICNYDSLEKHLPHILSQPIGHIIVDECVSIKSTKTARYKVCDKIIKANPQARVTLLSGTPVRNRINDLFAYMKIVGHPLGKNYAHFIREYTISRKGRGYSLIISGAKNTQKLWVEMSNFILRKRKEECLDLPPKIYTNLYFEMEDYKKEYDKAVREALEKTGKSSLGSVIHSINIVTAKAKLKGVIEFAESIIDQGEKLILFTGYTEIITSLQNHFGKSCVMINGSVDSRERHNRVERFMNDPECMVFLGNTIAAGSGLTLTVASNMIFCDFPFSPADLGQAEDRIHRIGQSKSANIYFAIAKESVDEHLLQLIHEKATDSSKVIDNNIGEFASRNISEILISELREKYNIPEYVEEAN